MPLEINRELDQDLESLLTMVFESEVDEKQKDLSRELQDKALNKAQAYVKNKVLKGIIKNQLKSIAEQTLFGSSDD